MDGTWGEREGRQGMPLLEGYGVSTRIEIEGMGQVLKMARKLQPTVRKHRRNCCGKEEERLAQ